MVANTINPNCSIGAARETAPVGGKIQTATHRTYKLVANKPGPHPASNATTMMAG